MVCYYLAIIFSFSALVYDVYAQQIRQEYIHYNDEAYNKGRSAVLQSFLKATPLFKTATLQDRFEQKAVNNLKREIEKLKAQ